MTLHMTFPEFKRFYSGQELLQVAEQNQLTKSYSSRKTEPAHSSFFRSMEPPHLKHHPKTLQPLNGQNPQHLAIVIIPETQGVALLQLAKVPP